MFKVYIRPETWILFSALNNVHFLRVFGKSLRNNAAPTILSSSPLWYIFQYHQHYSLQNATHNTHASTTFTLPLLAHQYGLSPIIMNEVFNFQEKERYNLKSGIHLASRNMHTAHFWYYTISSLGPSLWKLITR